MKVEIYKVTKKNGYLHSVIRLIQTVYCKPNNGHIVHKDYFVVCIASRFPHVRLCSSLITI